DVDAAPLDALERVLRERDPARLAEHLGERRPLPGRRRPGAAGALRPVRRGDPAGRDQRGVVERRGHLTSTTWASTMSSRSPIVRRGTLPSKMARSTTPSAVSPASVT